MQTLELHLNDRHIATVRRDSSARHRVTIGWRDGYDGAAPTLTESFRVIPGRGPSVTPEHWLRQLVYHVAIGNNDAHAENVALLHLATGTQLSELYDAVPNLFQEGRIDFGLAFAVNGVFDHRRISAESLVNEADSWGVLPRGSAPAIVAETLSAIEAAHDAVTRIRSHRMKCRNASDGM